ncbi:hypothetical protein N007_08390 [Alicyclobacillus acidoterrestris ATCC 49025]|nr:hypothetical protein N007_08390 [Alicyclobacillus acidoterrestris ATCC 49025]
MIRYMRSLGHGRGVKRAMDGRTVILNGLSVIM